MLGAALSYYSMVNSNMVGDLRKYYWQTPVSNKITDKNAEYYGLTPFMLRYNLDRSGDRSSFPNYAQARNAIEEHKVIIFEGDFYELWGITSNNKLLVTDYEQPSVGYMPPIRTIGFTEEMVPDLETQVDGPLLTSRSDFDVREPIYFGNKRIWYMITDNLGGNSYIAEEIDVTLERAPTHKILFRGTTLVHKLVDEVDDRTYKKLFQKEIDAKIIHTDAWDWRSWESPAATKERHYDAWFTADSDY